MESKVIINREWAMPNKNTFSIPPIRELIDRYGAGGWVDPFPFPFREDALIYLSKFPDCSVENLLYDPLYSPRQLKECYDAKGECLHDTTSAVWKRWKGAIARVVKPGGIVISFGRSTNGIGIARGFKIREILLVAHGGNHNDTICTVEQKVM
jgi:hypothetical protein